MVLFLTGATHAGKTRLAQTLLERYHVPYVSQDHLKMGLIRSGNTTLTPDDDALLVDYLWPITREMAKTAIENRQNLILEGCYIPFHWQEDFSAEYLSEIQYRCICLSETYLAAHFANVVTYADVIERRLDDDYCTPETILREHRAFRKGCEAARLPMILIRENYTEELEAALRQNPLAFDP